MNDRFAAVADIGVPPETCRSPAETILEPKGNFLAETQGEESTLSRRCLHR